MSYLLVLKPRPMKQVFTLQLLLLSLTFGQTPQGVSCKLLQLTFQETVGESNHWCTIFNFTRVWVWSVRVCGAICTSTDHFGMFNLSIGMGTVVERGVGAGQIDGAHSFSRSRPWCKKYGQQDYWYTTIAQCSMRLFAANSGAANNDNDQDPTNGSSLFLLSGTPESEQWGVCCLGNPESTSFMNPGGITIECVDMGISPLCGGVGLTENATLDPSVAHLLFTQWISQLVWILVLLSHWRKFQFWFAEAIRAKSTSAFKQNAHTTMTYTLTQLQPLNLRLMKMVTPSSTSIIEAIARIVFTTELKFQSQSKMDWIYMVGFVARICSS